LEAGVIKCGAAILAAAGWKPAPQGAALHHL